MNKLKGKIVNIQSEENISLVDIKVGNQVFRALVLETRETSPFLMVGNYVYILFKETEVSIGKNIKGNISLSNRIPCTVWKIKKGKILSQLELVFEDIKIVSIITTSSLERLGIKEGDSVEAFIKANEVSIMEMLNE